MALSWLSWTWLNFDRTWSSLAILIIYTVRLFVSLLLNIWKCQWRLTIVYFLYLSFFLCLFVTCSLVTCTYFSHFISYANTRKPCYDVILFYSIFCWVWPACRIVFPRGMSNISYMTEYNLKHCVFRTAWITSKSQCWAKKCWRVVGEYRL
jgi:hypothetical protein